MVRNETRNGTPQVNFRSGDLLPALQARTGHADAQSLGTIAARDLHHYYHALRMELPTFTEQEASLLVDALNGIITEPRTAHMLWALVEDAQRDGLAEKWGVDGLALVKRLRALTYTQSLAVADAAERFWNRTPLGEPIGDALRAVGLVR